jgi:hypothetical protein
VFINGSYFASRSLRSSRQDRKEKIVFWFQGNPLRALRLCVKPSFCLTLAVLKSLRAQRKRQAVCFEETSLRLCGFA